MKKILALTLAVFCTLSTSGLAQSVRIKELARLRGDRTNSLIGFGLVVGLNKTGDSPASFAKNKAVSSLLSRLGMQPDAQPLLTNAAAAVIVLMRRSCLPPHKNASNHWQLSGRR